MILRKTKISYGDYCDSFDTKKEKNNIINEESKEIKTKIIPEKEKIKDDIIRINNQNNEFSKIFNFNNSNIDIIYIDNNNIYFKGKDVCKILEYTNTEQTLRKIINKENKQTLENIYEIFRLLLKSSLTYNQKNTIYINESGLYQLIMRSKKPEAKKFHKWIYTNILLILRKTEISYGDYCDKLDTKGEENNIIDKSKEIKTEIILEKEKIKNEIVCTNKQNNEFSKIFNFNNSNIDVIYIDNDNIYFKGKDVCSILQYKDTEQSLKKIVDEENKQRLEYIYNTFRPVSKTGLTYNQKNTIYINESGLYQLIMRSKKPEAKKFQTWVCDEVLPTLRKTGQYNLNQIKWITNEELKIMYDNSQKINYGDYMNQNVLYLFHHKKDNFELAKIGFTSNIVSREKQLKREYNNTDMKLLNVKKCTTILDEKQLKSELKLKK